MKITLTSDSKEELVKLVEQVVKEDQQVSYTWFFSLWYFKILYRAKIKSK